MRRSTYCRHSYAICLDELFSEHTHAKVDMVETKQNRFAQSQLIWILNQGDIIFADNPRRVERVFDIEFPRSRTGVIPFPIYRHSMDEEEDRPTRFKNARDGKHLCENIIFSIVDDHRTATSLYIGDQPVENCARLREEQGMGFDGDDVPNNSEIGHDPRLGCSRRFLGVERYGAVKS